MDTLSLPEIQSAVAPFVVALISGLVARTIGRGWSPIGAVIGFLVAAWLINGVQFTPLTGTRKIILLAVAAGIVGVVIDAAGRLRLRPVILAVPSVGAALWMIWNVLARRDGSQWLILAGSASVYVAWLVVVLDTGRQRAIPTVCAGVALAIGTGAITLLSASALLGQLGFALAAANGAVLLLAVVWKNTSVGASFTLPVGMLAGLLGFAGLVFARVPWYGLTILAVVPLSAYVRLPTRMPRVVLAALHTLIGVGISAGAVALVWWLMEDIGGY